MLKKIIAFAFFLFALNFALGQGSQLPKYTVATLPAASTQPHYIVQVIDGASSTDCATGGGAQNVACVNVAGVWRALGSVSPTFTGNLNVTGTMTAGAAVLGAPLPMASGGTGATMPAAGLANLGGLPLSGGTLTGALNGTSAVLSGALASASSITQSNNSVLIADNYTGSDIGAKINAAVAACLGVFCTIQVNASGTITTPPVLPVGYTLVFSPSGTYTLNTNWVINHRGVKIFGNGAHFLYTKNNGGTAIYVGKGITSTVSITQSSASCSGSYDLVTSTGGSNFSTVDVGDQIFWSGNNAANIKNIIDSTHLCMTQNSIASGSGFTATFFIYPPSGQGVYTIADSVSLRDFTISDSFGTSGYTDTAIAFSDISNAMMENVTIYGFGLGTSTWAAGKGLALYGTLSSDFIAIRIYSSGNSFFAGQSDLVAYTVALLPSNANRFYGLDIETSSYSSGTAMSTTFGNGNIYDGLRIEGNNNTQVINEACLSGIYCGGQNAYHFSDYENNGTSSTTYEIGVATNNNLFSGPAQMESSSGNSGSIIFFNASTSGNVIQNIYFNATGTSQYAYRFYAGSSGKVLNCTIAVGLTINPPTGIEDTSNNYTVNKLTAISEMIAGNGTYDSGTANSVNTYYGVGVRSDTSGHNASYPLIYGCTGSTSNQVCLDPNAQGVNIGGALFLAPGRVGTFVCTSGGSIVVPQTLATSLTMITFSPKIVGGTISTTPTVKVPGNGTSFTVLCATGDTSTWNYWVWN